MARATRPHAAPGFPVDAMNALVRPYVIALWDKDERGAVYEHARTSSDAVTLRHRMAHEASQSFTKQWNQFDEHVLRMVAERLLPDRIYERERDLFVFFVSGQSALESLAYFLYTIGHQFDDDLFPMASTSDLRRISVASTLARYREWLAGSEIADQLDTLVADPEWGEWTEIRNTLIHRVAPETRHYFYPDGKPQNLANWGQDADWGKVELTGNLTSRRLEWLNHQLARLCISADRSLPTSPK